MFKVFCLVMGYFIGCIQSAYFVGKLSKNIDIRQFGSGNAGTTNVMRVLGKRAGVLTFICDIFKTIFAYVLCSLIFKGSGSFLFFTENGLLPGLYAGLGVVLGHNWPVFLNFKGGKGIAVTLGVLLCIDIRVALICYAFGFIVIIITRYVSLSSLTMVILMPIVMFIFKLPAESVILGIVFCVLAVYKHKDNIKRLIDKTENKIK